MRKVAYRNKRIAKAANSLPKRVYVMLLKLIHDLADLGSVRGEWPNYSKLGKNRHHCHLKKGNPTYVAVWSEESGTIFIDYVGTHEGAPY